MPEDPNREEHAWFRARLDVQALGLLDDDEEVRFLAHADACPACAAAMKTHRENAPVGGPDPHIPSHLIARWDRASRRLKGLPRRLIREHLERCASCRQDLEALGFTPSLPLEPGLEPPAEEDRPAPMPDDRHTIVVVQRPGRWTSWVWGGAAGAAIATAAAVLLVPMLVREITPRPGPPSGADPNEVRPGPTGPNVTTTPAATAGERLVVGVLPREEMLEPPVRAGESPETRIVVRDGQRFIHLVLPDLFLPDSTMLRLTLVDEAGATRLEEVRRYGELAAGRSLAIGHPSRHFVPGRYRLSFTPADAPDAPPIEFRLEVVLERPR